MNPLTNYLSSMVQGWSGAVRLALILAVGLLGFFQEMEGTWRGTLVQRLPGIFIIPKTFSACPFK
jgi:hypothetical protein